MSKPLFKEEDDAVATIKRCFHSIEIIYRLHGFPDNIASTVVVHVVGRSLMQHVNTICEALLYLVCRERLQRWDEIQRSKWPKVHELSKFCEQCQYLDCPPKVYEAAGKMANEKKNSDKKAELTPDDLAQFFSEAAVFIEWLQHAVHRSIGCIEEIGSLQSFIGHWLEQYKRESTRNTGDYQWSFRYQDVNTDNMTDEEEDELYRQRKGNKRETMAPLFIYLILQKYDKDNRAHVSDIQAILEEEYEIELSRGAIERTLNTMVDGGDVNIWSGLKRGSGYWYSEEDENIEE